MTYEEFCKLKDSYHNLELEKILNCNEALKLLELDVCDEIFYINPLDFELEWKNNVDEDACFEHRMSLKYMFKNNFTYAILNEKSALYKYLLTSNEYGRHRVLRSPETNICESNRRQLAIFCEDDKLYCYTGYRSYKNLNTEFFCYLGRIKRSCLK